MVVFGAAGSVPKTSRAFVFVVFGFFCSVCREVRKESIALRFCVDAARCSATAAPACAALLAALGLAAVDYTSCTEL